MRIGSPLAWPLPGHSRLSRLVLPGGSVLVEEISARSTKAIRRETIVFRTNPGRLASTVETLLDSPTSFSPAAAERKRYSARSLLLLYSVSVGRVAPESGSRACDVRTLVGNESYFRPCLCSTAFLDSSTLLHSCLRTGKRHSTFGIVLHKPCLTPKARFGGVKRLLDSLPLPFSLLAPRKRTPKRPYSTGLSRFSRLHYGPVFVGLTIVGLPVTKGYPVLAASSTAYHQPASPHCLFPSSGGPGSCEDAGYDREPIHPVSSARSRHRQVTFLAPQSLLGWHARTTWRIPRQSTPSPPNSRALS